MEFLLESSLDRLIGLRLQRYPYVQMGEKRKSK